MVDERFHLRLHLLALRRNDAGRFRSYRPFRRNLLHGLADNLQALAHLRNPDHVAREAVRIGARGHVEVKFIITGIRKNLAIVVRHACSAQRGPGHAECDGIFGRDIAYALGAAHPDAVAREQLFVFVDAPGHHLHEFFDALQVAGRRFQGQPADADIAGHHALPGDKLKNIQDFFALAETIQKNRHRPEVDRVRAQPHQVRGNALQLHHQHADVLRALGHFDAQKFFDGQAICEVIAERIEVIDAVGEGDGLRIRLVLAGFFNAGVQVTHVRNGFDDIFAVQLQQNAQHAVRRRVLRPHVENHGFGLAGGRLDGAGLGLNRHVRFLV